MRRDGTLTVVNVKVERTSTESRTVKPRETSETDGEPVRPVRIKKEKIDEPIPSKSTTSKATTESKKQSTGSNDSLEILPMETNPTIELSDDEHGNDVDKMPPPAFVPPAKVTKEKKIPVKTRSTRSKQTKRKPAVRSYT